MVGALYQKLVMHLYYEGCANGTFLLILAVPNSPHGHSILYHLVIAILHVSNIAYT